MFKKYHSPRYFILLAILSSFLFLGLKGSDDLVASMAQLPGLADTPDKGAFVEIVKAIDDVYSDGKIAIQLFPFARSVNNVIEGKADFHVPGIRNPKIDQSPLPYATVTEKMGTVQFVIYSNVDNIITKKMLDDSILNSKGGVVPYKIESPAGIENQFPFRYISSNNVEQSLKKLSAKRIDAIVWAQEEVDLTIRKLKMKNIHRESWQSFEDIIIIAKGPDSKRIDKILSDALKKLRTSGKLGKIYSQVHRPYESWQPSQMGW